MNGKPSSSRVWIAILGIAVVVLLLVQLNHWRTSSASEQPPVPVEDSLAQILKTGVMKVGYIDYPPAVIKDPNTGQLSGEFVDIARYIGSQLNVKVEFQEASWSTFITGLQTHQYDISIAPTYIEVSRAANVAFTQPIAYLGNSAGVRKSDPRFVNVKSPMDFDQPDIVVAVVQGEAADLYVKEHFTKAKILELSGSDLTAPLTLVANGQADVGLTDAYVTKTFVAQNSEIRDVFANDPYDISPMSWAVRPDDYRLLNFLNNSLVYLESTGKVEEWQQKYHATWMAALPGIQNN
jgi:ABC-type amino acid transport substrate-binding protein